GVRLAMRLPPGGASGGIAHPGMADRPADGGLCAASPYRPHDPPDGAETGNPQGAGANCGHSGQPRHDQCAAYYRISVLYADTGIHRKYYRRVTVIAGKEKVWATTW